MLVVSSYCDWNSSTINIKDQLTWDVNQLERSMDFSNKSSIGLICLSTWGILSSAWLWLLRLLFLFYVYCLLKSFLRQFECSRASKVLQLLTHGGLKAAASQQADAARTKPDPSQTDIPKFSGTIFVWIIFSRDQPPWWIILEICPD